MPLIDPATGEAFLSAADEIRELRAEVERLQLESLWMRGLLKRWVVLTLGHGDWPILKAETAAALKDRR
jgi:hypothetical protein